MTEQRATEERILAAAVQLFASKGFNGSSTREIARLADVNQTSLFRYFPRKQDLFWAAIKSELSRLRIHKELRIGLAEGKPPETVLPLLIEFLVDAATYHPELTRMLRFSLLELGAGAESLYRQRLGPIFNSILEYLQNWLATSEERPEASILIIGAFMTALSHDGLVGLFTGNTTPYGSTEDKIAAHTRFWLTVLSSIGRGEHLLQRGARFREVDDCRPAVTHGWSTAEHPPVLS